MTTIQFYHLTATPLERALPKLLQKAFDGGFKTLVVADSDERLDQLNQLLWTYDPNSFLPHGSEKDGQAEKQPILLSTLPDPKNAANILAITDGRVADNAQHFERVLDIFDGSDAQAVASARMRWKNYKDAGHEISYFRQTQAGGWEKAA
jgi:DNA polymerase-3 subunit chi